MRKHGGKPSRQDKHVTLAAISPPGVARGRFVGGQQSGLAGCKPPPLFTRGASSCSSQGRRQGEPRGASPRPSAPTYLPTWGVGACVFLCARSACTPPLLAGLCGVGVCVWARVSAAPRHSWLGCWGVCVCVCVRARLVPRRSRLRGAVFRLDVAWHLFLCRGSLRVVRAVRGCGTRWPLLLGTCPCALVLAGGVPLWRASWPRVGAPRLTRSGRSRCSGQLARRRGAFTYPGVFRPRIYWAAARGTWRPAEDRALCPCPWPLAGGLLRVVPVRGPAMGLFLAGPSGVGLGLRAQRLLACVDPVTDASGFPIPSVFRWGTRPVHRGCFVWTPTLPLLGTRTPHPGPVRVCVCVRLMAGSGWPASRARFGAPHLLLWRFLLLSLSARRSPGWGCPASSCSCVFFSFVRPPCLWRSVFSGPWCLGPWRLVPPPPSFVFFLFFLSPPP